MRPLRPPAPIIGGKRMLARRLVERIEAVPHRTYAEGFLGGGGVFLRRKSKPPAEVVNDLSLDVANLFRVLQRHYQALMDMLQWQITSRAEFQRLCSSDPATLTDLERAARFLYLQRLAYGGKIVSRAFGVSHHQPGRFDVRKLASQLEDIHERLAGVIIERLTWQAFVARYDAPETLFFLDPPYLGSEGDYGKGMFDRSEFAEMSERLACIKGRFILTLNATPETLEIFKRFDIEPVETKYGIAGRGPQAAHEIIVRNAQPG